VTAGGGDRGLDPLLRWDLERRQERAKGYATRRRGRAYRDAEESEAELRSSRPLSRGELIERDERNIGLELSFAMEDHDEARAQELARRVVAGEFDIEHVVRYELTPETIDRFVDDYCERLPADDRPARGDLDRSRIVEHALAEIGRGAS
jgi:hypothetical protein